MTPALMFAQLTLPQLLVPLAILGAGMISGVLYLRSRQYLNAALVLLATASLALLVAGLRGPSLPSQTLSIDSDGFTAAQLERVEHAASIELRGDGLRDAEWRDVPARPVRAVQQKATASPELLWLDFPRSLTLGRHFTLTVRRGQAHSGWRLQLLAENRQVLADSGLATSAAETQRVQWLPPVAEALVLQARLLDSAGKVLAQGPLPLQVREAIPLQIQGRFDAPSFDVRVLNQLLTDGGASVDWDVALGKAVARSETARTALTAPNLLVVDAAYVEHLAPPARSALLASVRQGMPLLVLGGNAADAALWQREFGLRLQAQSATTEKEDMRQFALAGSTLSLTPASLNPVGTSGGWSVLASDDAHQQRLPWLWQRELQQGRIIWLGVSDWHRYAISAPQALTAWWQSALDAIALPSPVKAGWQLDDPMPLVGLRSELCAQGVPAGTAIQLRHTAPAGQGGVTAMPVAPRLQIRHDRADALCSAIWPQRAGWLTLSLEGMSGAQPLYVYDRSDWPAWQRALRRDATARYAARALPDSAPPAPATGRAATAGESAGATAAAWSVAPPTALLPVAPFGILFLSCMLVLWWREQLRPAATAAHTPAQP